MNRIAIVTGATSGFGRAIALRLAGLGYQLIVTGRRKELLDTLSAEISEKYTVSVLTLNFDVRDNNACQEAINSLPEEYKTIDLLVNNAGLAAGVRHGAGPVARRERRGLRDGQHRPAAVPVGRQGPVGGRPRPGDRRRS